MDEAEAVEDRATAQAAGRAPAPGAAAGAAAGASDAIEYFPSGEPQSRSIGRKLTVAARRIVSRFDRAVERHGLSRAKYTVIGLVAIRPGASQRAIAERLQVTEVTAGRLIERLCADGYLERRENPADRRSHFIHPTQAARPLLDLLNAVATEQEGRTFAGFSATEMTTLEGYLERIVANLAPDQDPG